MTSYKKYTKNYNQLYRVVYKYHARGYAIENRAMYQALPPDIVKGKPDDLTAIRNYNPEIWQNMELCPILLLPLYGYMAENLAEKPSKELVIDYIEYFRWLSKLPGGIPFKHNIPETPRPENPFIRFSSRCDELRVFLRLPVTTAIFPILQNKHRNGQPDMGYIGACTPWLAAIMVENSSLGNVTVTAADLMVPFPTPFLQNISTL